MIETKTGLFTSESFCQAGNCDRVRDHEGNTACHRMINTAHGKIGYFDYVTQSLAFVQGRCGDAIVNGRAGVMSADDQSGEVTFVPHTAK